jgi:hypothetical protein
VLKQLLTGFEIITVQDLGWAGITNGSLLERAEGQFDVLITSDQNLKYQRNLVDRHLAILTANKSGTESNQTRASSAKSTK